VLTGGDLESVKASLMIVDTKLVGIIRLESTAAAAFLNRGFRPRPVTASPWRDFAECAAYASVAADFPRLRRELQREYRRLQARLAA
jgi:hypothetical protein